MKEESFIQTPTFSDSQILVILKQAESGTALPDLWSEHHVSVPTFLMWCENFSCMGASLMFKMKELEAENT